MRSSHLLLVSARGREVPSAAHRAPNAIWGTATCMGLCRGGPSVPSEASLPQGHLPSRGRGTLGLLQQRGLHQAPTRLQGPKHGHTLPTSDRAGAGASPRRKGYFCMKPFLSWD